MKSEKRWLPISAVARICGLSSHVIRQFAAAGRLRSLETPSGRLLIDPTSLTDLKVNE
jgi:hypothetical protein